MNQPSGGAARGVSAAVLLLRVAGFEFVLLDMKGLERFLPNDAFC